MDPKDIRDLDMHIKAVQAILDRARDDAGEEDMKNADDAGSEYDGENTGTDSGMAGKSLNMKFAKYKK